MIVSTFEHNDLWIFPDTQGWRLSLCPLNLSRAALLGPAPQRSRSVSSRPHCRRSAVKHHAACPQISGFSCQGGHAGSAAGPGAPFSVALEGASWINLCGCCLASLSLSPSPCWQWLSCDHCVLFSSSPRWTTCLSSMVQRLEWLLVQKLLLVSHLTF